MIGKKWNMTLCCLVSMGCEVGVGLKIEET